MELGRSWWSLGLSPCWLNWVVHEGDQAFWSIFIGDRVIWPNSIETWFLAKLIET